MRLRAWLLRVVVTGACVLSVPAWAAQPSKGARPASNRPAQTLTIDNDRRIDVNTINMWVTNHGSFAYDLNTGNSGLVYPRGTDKTAVFASGLWLGCTVGGEVRTVVGEYSQEYGPGAMVGGTFDDPTRTAYVVYKVARYSGDPQDTAHVERAAAYPDDRLVHHSWSEYIKGAKPYGAPTRMYDLPDPNNPGSTIAVEGPDVLGDQMLWCVYNDANQTNHTNDAGNSSALGVQVEQTTFAFNRQGPLGSTLFLKFKIKNKGTNVLDSMFVSLWSDPDLGGFTDDLVGCDTTLSLGYVYNANNNDQIYGSAPPTVGYDFFLGPVNAVGDTLGLVSFNKYINGTDPAQTSETYNYMNGLLPDGSPTIDPTTGAVTRFFHPGDPVLGVGWLDANPADRRFLLTSGPFRMAPGDSQTIVGAIIVGQGKNRLSSISALKFFDTFAQDAFDRDFDLPSPPAQPKVDVTVDHQTVRLCWDSASRLGYTEPGYTFEGYNVYQGASISGPWTLVATYDEINAVRVIFDEVFDVETGQIIPQFPVAFGSDVGVSFCHTITQDAVRGGSLKDATEYYFAVTSYGYGPGERPKVLENAQEAIRVIPQRPPSGTDPATASATDVVYLQKDTAPPPATDIVSVEVVTPSLVTGHTYKVTFDPINPPFEGVVGTDTATVKHSWSLTDSTTNTVLLSGQLNRRGDDDYRVVDGMRVRVTGQYFPKFQNGVYANVGPNRRALTGVDWGPPEGGFFGGAGTGFDFFGGTLDPAADPDSFTTVELRFDPGGATQKAYRFLRLEKESDTNPPPQGRSYTYAGFHDVNFTCWDAINNIQLEVAFVERTLTDDAGTILPFASQPATLDSTWLPDDDGLGGREYLFVIRRPYTGTERSEIATDASIADDSLPLLFALWSHLRDATDVIDPGDVFSFIWANPAKDNDVYAFDTSTLKVGNASLAAGKLDRIRVVPNPYYTRSAFELNQFNRAVRFINLPETCTIRIFNLGGDLVRTLQKSVQTSSVLNWDLETENGLPVASGIYVFHVDAGPAGSMFGRIAVFMEKERLNNF